MTNAAPQLNQIPDYDLEIYDISDPISQKPQSWELYVERIAPDLARQTGESIQEIRRQLLAAFRPVPTTEINTAELLRAMDWDDETYDNSYSARPAVDRSGVISKNNTTPGPGSEQLIANENGIPIYLDNDNA